MCKALLWLDGGLLCSTNSTTFYEPFHVLGAVSNSFLRKKKRVKKVFLQFLVWKVRSRRHFPTKDVSTRRRPGRHTMTRSQILVLSSGRVARGGGGLGWVTK